MSKKELSDDVRVLLQSLNAAYIGDLDCETCIRALWTLLVGAVVSAA